VEIFYGLPPKFGNEYNTCNAELLNFIQQNKINETKLEEKRKEHYAANIKTNKNSGLHSEEGCRIIAFAFLEFVSEKDFLALSNNLNKISHQQRNFN